MNTLVQSIGLKINGRAVLTVSYDYAFVSDIDTAYSTFDFTINGQYKPERFDTVDATLGDLEFHGFVWEISRIEDLKYRIKCRSNVAKLTGPFCPKDTTFDYADSILELFNKYSNMSGVAIQTIGVPEVPILGAWERNSQTPLDAIMAICEIIGLSYWDDSGILVITPTSINGIDTTYTKLSKDDYFDFLAENELSEEGYLGKVIAGCMGDGGNTGDDIPGGDPCQITGEVSPDGGVLLKGPSVNFITSVDGLLNMQRVSKKLTESANLTYANTFTCSTLVENVISVTIDGNSYSGYTIDGNVIVFPRDIYGSVAVTYVGSVVIGTTNLKLLANNQKEYSLKVYVCSNVIEIRGRFDPGQVDPDPVEPGGSHDIAKGCTIVTPSNFNQMAGFVLPIIVPPDNNNGTLLKFYKASGGYASVATNKISNSWRLRETATSGDKTANVRHAIKSVIEVRNNGEILDTSKWIAHTESTLIEFTMPIDTITVVYDTFAKVYKIGGDGSEYVEPIIMEVTTPCGDKQVFSLSKFDKNNPCTYPPKIPQIVRVNIAGTLGLSIMETEGISVVVNYPDGGFNNITVMPDGFVEVWVDQWGVYIIDTNSILTGSKVQLTAKEPK